jgi:hypothetical protein
MRGSRRPGQQLSEPRGTQTAAESAKDGRTGDVSPEPPMLVDRARGHGVRWPALFDSEQERRPTTARWDIYNTDDDVRVVEKFDRVLRHSEALTLLKLLPLNTTAIV